MRRTQNLLGRLSNYELVWPLSVLGGDSGEPFTGWFTIFWSLACFGGFLISAVGLVMAKSDKPYWLSKGMRFELSGLYLFLAGPACYGVINLVLYFSRQLDPDNMAQFCLALGCSAAILARIHLVKETADKK